MLQDLYATEADLLPDTENKVLTVRVHNASRPAANKAFIRLFDELNSAELCYPGTNGHGPTWSLNTQAQPTTKHESNSAAYWYFHITAMG
ncbi:putative transposase [uncultured Desulfobacter sp.]|uniref:putative transposase n=1 Tax=uncultured Desulfobacter sp. TaxID=240139 RepID=UPI003748610B